MGKSCARPKTSVGPKPEVIYHVLTKRGCQVDRGILPALQGAGASQIREKIRVRKVGVFEAVEGIANHEKFAGREVVIYAASQAVPSRVRLAGKIQQTADIIHFASIGIRI